MDLLSQIQRMLLPIKRKISLLLQKALVQSVIDSKNIQLVKVKLGSDDIKDMMERLQPYGLTSVPSVGAEAVVGFIGGNRDNGVVILVDDSKSRKKDLLPGDVAVYRKGGSYILLKSDSIEIHDPQVIKINSPSVILGGNVAAPTSGIVTGECICAFTGAPHADTSLKVKAVK